MPLPTVREVVDAIDRGTASRILPDLLEHARAMPFNVPAQVMLARVFEAERRWVDALAAWRSAALLLPNSPTIVDGLRRVSKQVHGSPVSAGPVEQPEPAPAPNRNEDAIDDLDRLISQLQNARIVPAPDPDSIPEVEMEDESENMVSETLARIYAAQNQFEEAARVFDQLSFQQPDRSDEFSRKAAEMRARSKV